MTFKELKNKIKEEQKQLAKEITRGKQLRKPSNRHNMTDAEIEKYIVEYSGFEYFSSFYVDKLSQEYRYRHIVYSNMFCGIPYEKVEKTTKPHNKPNQFKLSQIRKKWENQLDETLRDNS